MKRLIWTLALLGMFAPTAHANPISWMTRTFSDSAHFFSLTITGTNPRGTAQFTLNVTTSVHQPPVTVHKSFCGSVLCFEEDINQIALHVTGVFENLLTHKTFVFRPEIGDQGQLDEDGGAIFRTWFPPMTPHFANHYTWDFEGQWDNGLDTEVSAVLDDSGPGTQQSGIDIAAQSPEPSTLLLLGSGLVGIGLSARRYI